MEIIKPLHDQCSSHTETSQWICHADQLTGFYVIRKLVVFELKKDFWAQIFT